MATIYARLINQCKFKNHILFSTSLYKINEGDQRSDETELFNNLNNNHILTETDTDDIDVKSQIDQNQIRNKIETKGSGWIFDKINSMKI